MAHRPMLVFGVGVAEFDQKVGNSLTLQYPENVFNDFDVDSLANMCLPDGAHIHQEDWTYSVLEKPSKLVGDDGEKFLYAIAVFRNLVDPSLPRGAMQKAFLVVSCYPFFNLYEPLMKATLVRIMEGKDRSAPRVFYDELNTTYQKKTLQVHLWNESFPLAYPVLEPDEFGGASLRSLVKIFGVNTMYLWYSLLMEERILFCGQPARTVGRCAFSAPLLVKPLTGFKKSVVPYVTLLDMGGALARPTYICGTTNLLLEMRSELYDSLGNVSSASVVSQSSGVKIMGADKALIKSVIAGIEDGKGEMWVREQFRRYTEKFLEGLAENRLKMEQHRRLLGRVKDSEMFDEYESTKARAKAEGQKEQETFMDYLVKLKGGHDDMKALDRPKLFYLLDKTLVDLPDIEEMIDNNGLDVVEDGLSADGAQVRKYAVNVLAKIAMNIKGQIHIVCGMKSDFLSRVISMVEDPMPNVAIAACSCLVRISKLYIGADALLRHNVVPLTTKIILDPNGNLTLKTQAVATLLQIYTYFPETPKPPVDSFIAELQVKDEKYRGQLSQLLDLWEADIISLVPTDDMRKQLEGLQVSNHVHRAQATAFMQAMLVAYSNKSIELAAADGVKIIHSNADAAEPDHELTRFSLSVLSLVADTYTGCQEILRLKIIEWALRKLKKTSSIVRTAYVLRFLNVCCQRPGPCLRFYCSSGMEGILSVMFRCAKSVDKLSLLKPCVDVLKHAIMQLSAVSASASRNQDEIRKQAPALPGVLQCCADDEFQVTIKALVEQADTLEKLHPLVLDLENLIHQKREMKALRLGLTEVCTDNHSRRRETISLDTMQWTFNKLYVPRFPSTTPIPEESEPGDRDVV